MHVLFRTLRAFEHVLGEYTGTLFIGGSLRLCYRPINATAGPTIYRGGDQREAVPTNTIHSRYRSRRRANCIVP